MAKSLSESLRDAIIASGLGPAVLEQKAGVDRASIARFVSGRTSLRLDKADRLAAALNLSLQKGDEMTNVMNPNVMIFSAASETAQTHYRETMDKGLSLAQVCDVIDGPEIVYTLRDAYPEGVVYCWGGRSGGQDEHYFSLMTAGDLVLCYRNRRIVSYSYLVATTKNVKLGRFCWPDERVRPYDLVYFVTKPIDVDKPINELSKYFGQMYQGLRRVAGTDDIIREYGSLEHFVNDTLLK